MGNLSKSHERSRGHKIKPEKQAELDGAQLDRIDLKGQENKEKVSGQQGQLPRTRSRGLG